MGKQGRPHVAPATLPYAIYRGLKAWLIFSRLERYSLREVFEQPVNQAGTTIPQSYIKPLTAITATASPRMNSVKTALKPAFLVRRSAPIPANMI